MTEDLSIQEHDARSEHRTQRIMGKIDAAHKSHKEETMAEPVNVFTSGNDGGMGGAAAMMAPAMMAAMGGHGGMGGAGAGMGAGLGAGVFGGLLGGLLFGNNGLGRNGNGNGSDGCITPANLTAALAGVTSSQDNSTLLQTLGDIKASIPYNEGQVQLALAGAQADINSNISQGLQVLVAGQAATNQNVHNAIASALAAQGNTDKLILGTGAALQLQASQNTASIITAIRDDGDRSRAQSAAEYSANLQRQLTLAESALRERDADIRHAATNVTVTQSVNQNQLNFQNQQQQQQQLILLSQIAAGLGTVTQLAHATNSNIIAGNAGAVTMGAQTSSPVNVNA